MSSSRRLERTFDIISTFPGGPVSSLCALPFPTEPKLYYTLQPSPTRATRARDRGIPARMRNTSPALNVSSAGLTGSWKGIAALVGSFWLEIRSPLFSAPPSFGSFLPRLAEWRGRDPTGAARPAGERTRATD